MRTSEAFDLVVPALVKAKAEIAMLPLVKDRQGDKAKYLQLTTLLAAIEPVLLTNDMVLVQGCGENIVTDGVVVALTIETTLLHMSGQWIRTAVMIPVAGAQKKGADGGGFFPPSAQSGGITITYGRRYGIFAMFSLAVDEDTDGAEKSKERRRRAGAVAEGVVTRTNARTDALREKLAKAQKLVVIERCMDCSAVQGQPHHEACPNA